jgi:hypothetical protein
MIEDFIDELDHLDLARMGDREIAATFDRLADQINEM